MPKIIENLSEKIIEETRRQVMEVGYTALNIRDVAKNCGVGVGTVYNYFPSKDVLVARFLLQDWKKSLERIHKAAEKCGKNQSNEVERLLLVIYQELSDYYAQYSGVFHAEGATIQAPPKKYHIILRGQIAEVVRPLCGDDFTAEFISEALLTWTVEGQPFKEIWTLLRKVIE